MNKKISRKFSIGIGLLTLSLLPLKNVYANRHDRSYENLASVSIILMVTVALVIFVLIFARGKDLLTKVMVFCILLALVYLLLLFCGADYLVFVLAAIIMYAHIRFPLLLLQEKKHVKKFVFIFIFLLIIFLLSTIKDSIING